MTNKSRLPVGFSNEAVWSWHHDERMPAQQIARKLGVYLHVVLDAVEAHQKIVNMRQPRDKQPKDRAFA